MAWKNIYGIGIAQKQPTKLRIQYGIRVKCREKRLEEKLLSLGD